MLIGLNKPYDVLCQFTDPEGRRTLADFVSVPGVYPAGRLDRDSEGLVLLTDDGRLQHALSDPSRGTPKHYWALVEGLPGAKAMAQLRRGLQLKDGPTRPARTQVLAASPAGLWKRDPAPKARAGKPMRWLEVVITEGRNRQVRRMLAAVGLPCLRLIRHRIGDYSLEGMAPGEWREFTPKGVDP